jgi:penicillin-binding protein 2
MFERRLKILLGFLAGFTLLLLFRAAWLQIVQGADFDRRAAEASRKPIYLETSRGRILDVNGMVIAEDAPCIDAAVDYRAIDFNFKESQEWLAAQARRRLTERNAYKGDRATKAKLVEEEIERIKADLQDMWVTMARVSGQSLEQIELAKEAIKARVSARQRSASIRKYEAAKKRYEDEKREPAPGWFKWLTEESTAPPQIDNFSALVTEQLETHAVLHAIDNDAYLVLNKLRERCPGLELRKGVRRNYPLMDVACQVIGNLSPVMREDLDKDPNKGDDRREFEINDYVGRGGIERLAEQKLRGSRGLKVLKAGSDEVEQTVEPQPGENVRTTLDMDLQMRVQEAFMRYKEMGDPAKDLRVTEIPVHEMHGAAVVIDVATGEVRAMVSYPTYDLNRYDTLYPTLVSNVIDKPLLNRATQAALEPGSTVKPMVGLSAITAGVARVDETIECTGYLVIDGRRYQMGRCWVASKFGSILGEAGVAHHPIPWKAPHPTGFLTFADGLERSCNVFFENMADRLKLEGLNYWMQQFGLGNYTGIGIAEIKGHVPNPKEKLDNWRSATWFSGIGQSQVLATPVQMANVAATIARRGIWVRPHLLVSDTPTAEHRDLHLNQAAVDEAFEGMINVVNAPAGTGTQLHRDDVLIAGKTGTAQAAMFSVLKRDDKGNLLHDQQGRVEHEFFEPSTPEVPNLKMPWYRGAGNSGHELGHAWFIGFAPARAPRIAFAVMVEYGGSGGADAGPVARAILEACVEHGYFKALK